MLRQMRRRMIGTAMAAFFAVILLIVILVNAFNYVEVSNRADRTIDSIRSFEDAGERIGEDRPPREPFAGLPDPEENFMTRFFVVRYGEDSKEPSVYMDYIASVNEKEAVRYAEKVLRSGKESGYLEAYRYHVYTENGEKKVVFLNAAREQEQIRSLLIISLLTALGSLLLVFILVYFFSGYAIRPFVQNIENQKRFITDASHELKTPITSIAASTDILELECGEREWTRNIHAQTRRMSKLVGELVALSRLDEAGAVLNREKFSLTEAAWEIVETVQPQAKAAGRSMSVDIQDDLVYTGDKAQIQKMMSVLLDNAVRYSDENGKIEFSVYREKKIYIRVKNSCRFTSPPELDRLFDRFYRPDASRNTQTGGTGIGLSLAKAVAEKHGGSITAKCPDEDTILFEAVL